MRVGKIIFKLVGNNYRILYQEEMFQPGETLQTFRNLLQYVNFNTSETPFKVREKIITSFFKFESGKTSGLMWSQKLQMTFPQIKKIGQVLHFVVSFTFSTLYINVT